MKIVRLIIVICLPLFHSCNYLDVVPDNVATIEMAFNNRASAEKYLATCYNFLPEVLNPFYNAALTAGDDISWNAPKMMFFDNTQAWEFARNGQNTNNPYFNYWGSMFRGVHECNIFLKNIYQVPDMPNTEKERWRAEVLTLKAYYLFWLFQHYGPIPLLKENLGIDASQEEMNVPRAKVDEVVDYIVSLLDEAKDIEFGLPERITSTYNESGRITLASVYALKAKVLVWAASPLFNGNKDYAGFIDPTDGQPFFNQDASEQVVKKKWQKAAEACVEAVNFVEAAGYELYEFDERVPFELNEESKLLLTLRNIVPSRFSDEELFGPGSVGSEEIQDQSQARLTSYMVGISLERTQCQHAPTLNIVKKFYSVNGVPIDEDISGIDFSNTVVPTPDNIYRFSQNYKTAQFHLNREPRFYAFIGFDGGKWFMGGENETPEEAYDLKTKKGDIGGLQDIRSSITGYFPKKLVSYKNAISQQSWIKYRYSVPIIRLADLYLLCSEALNEYKDQPDDEFYSYIQKVRWRAGLDKNRTLTETWAQFSNNPLKPKTKSGMREIIRQERDVELAFEGHRYHDLRRWKAAVDAYNNVPIQGWSIGEMLAEAYYRPKNIYIKKFTPRDYFWPIKDADLYVNPNLVQNPYW